MSFFDAVVLGVVQGIAEFLPISSSGHLILARETLGLVTEHGLAVDAVLQLATACAVLLYFRTDIHALLVSAWQWIRGKEVPSEERILIGALGFGTLPAVVAGLMLESYMETQFRSSVVVAAALVGGSLLFLGAEYWYRHQPPVRELSIRRGILIGVFQTLALVPGVSRSGATIAGGMFMGLSREHAARFSFLLSLPIIVGSGVKKALDLTGEHIASTEWHMIALAALVAWSTGMLAIHYLLRFLRTHSLMPFIIYRVLLALGIVLAW